MSLTTYMSPASELPVAAAHLLDLDGLRQVVQLLDRLHAEGRFPPPQASEAADLVEEVRYD